MPNASIKGRRLKVDKARPKGEGPRKEGGSPGFQRQGPRFNTGNRGGNFEKKGSIVGFQGKKTTFD